MYVMLLISSGHLVLAHIVSCRSQARFGNMFFRNVDSCIVLVQMPSGRHSVNYVMEEIVD
jgi:hypothetical protein